MTQRMIPLDQLKFGHEAEPPINARRVGRDDGITELAASIGAHGLITPLKVKEIAGVPYVGIGNRRLAAMRLLVEQSQMAANALVTCDEFDSTVDDPREVALAEQIMRAPLHEADQYEEFTTLANAGLSEASIASRFGIEPKRVKRILALGRLSPMILEWWRGEEPSRETVETVRAFTLAPSIDDQEKLFKKLDKQGDVRAWSVKRALGADNHEAARAIKIAGLDAYKAAGGHMTQDLFGDNHVIQNPEIAEQVANEKINAVLDGLRAEGWSWVSTAGELPYTWGYSWGKEAPSDGKMTADEKKQIKKLEKAATKGTDGAAGELDALRKAIADRQWTPEQLAKAGAVLEIGHHGDLTITRCVVKPEASKPEKALGPKGEKAAPTISNAMMHRLSIQVTQAAQKALTDEPRVGLVALLAGFAAGSGHGPVKVRQEGLGAVDKYGVRAYNREGGESFSSAFARLSAMPDADLFRVAAGIAGQALDMQSQNALAAPLAKGGDVLAAAIDPDRMTAALRETWDAVDYFNGVAKPIVIQAIREAVNEDEARKADKLKKKELVEFAVKNVVGTAWLPPELRCATYSGPGEVPKLEAAPPPLDDDPDFDEIDEDEDLDEVA